jgi:hypothetical protein
MYRSDKRDVDNEWISGTNSRGHSILVRRDLVRATVPAGSAVAARFGAYVTATVRPLGFAGS